MYLITTAGKALMGGKRGKSCQQGDQLFIGKVCIKAKWPMRLALISDFCTMKPLGVFLFSLRWDASPSQG